MKGGSFNAMDKVRNGSADSGKSSSPDTGSSSSSSSRDASIADSLEDNQAQQQHQSRGGKEKLPNGPDEDDVLTIKNYQDAAALSKSVINSNSSNNNSNNNNNNNINNNNDNENSHDIIKTSTPTIQDASGEIKPQNLSEKENSLKTTSVVESENNAKVDSQLDKSHSDSLKQQETKNQQQQQQQVNNSTTTNNNYSGLNLNMTASEMRELIARRKKFDPKKAQMNIRQKYEIIQQM